MSKERVLQLLDEIIKDAEVGHRGATSQDRLATVARKAKETKGVLENEAWFKSHVEATAGTPIEGSLSSSSTCVPAKKSSDSSVSVEIFDDVPIVTVFVGNELNPNGKAAPVTFINHAARPNITFGPHFDPRAVEDALGEIQAFNECDQKRLSGTLSWSTKNPSITRMISKARAQGFSWDQIKGMSYKQLQDLDNIGE